ncbi:carbohydrate ABC transporter permease [Paenibacillus chungangensis]|uniref:Carbohydrate ABC transporter permease n=1 Tax=Paenibacillus chungangensis TaxID=696535 RepID=A0ABW3HQY5_9BACL
MFYKESLARRAFVSSNYVLLTIVTILGVIPFVHLLAVSLSSNTAVTAGEVTLWPKGFTLEAYRFLGQKVEFIRSLVISLERVVLGTIINMTLAILTAYPLSKEVRHFRYRTIYVWFFVFTIFFGGGLIPTYIVVKETGLMNSIWALIIPGALNVWNMIMLLNFFRGIPKDLQEAAVIDGASHWRTLWSIYLPIAKPAIATILLFTIVGHWNAWFDGILYMNSPDKYPLQTYLSTLVTSINRTKIGVDDLNVLQNLSEQTLRTAQIFLGALPIMMVYPFLQKHFTKGITIGSVKE